MTEYHASGDAGEQTTAGALDELLRLARERGLALPDPATAERAELMAALTSGDEAEALTALGLDPLSLEVLGELGTALSAFIRLSASED